MANIEYNLLACVLNDDECYARFNRFPNIFQDEIAYNIQEVLLKVKTNNKQIIIEYIKKRSSECDIDKFYEVFAYYYNDRDYKIYLEKVLAEYQKHRLEIKAKQLLTSPEVNLSDFNDEVTKILTEISVDDNDDISHVGTLAREVLNDWASDKPLTCSGIEYFDCKGGIEEDDYIIIAARSSQGKTTYALNIIMECLQAKEKIGLITMETNKKKITQLMACIKAGIEEWTFRGKVMTKDQNVKIRMALEWLDSQPFYLDSSTCDINVIRQKAKKMVKKFGCQKIFIDYLTYIDLPKGKSAYEGVTYNSKELKKLCREFKVPFYVLAQLNRGNEKENREPRKTDLRDSGAIEQDADIIILLHQDTENTTEGMLQADTVKLNCIVDKWRNGSTGRYIKTFNKKLRKIY
jgi:replicative DNA helicase